MSAKSTARGLVIGAGRGAIRGFGMATADLRPDPEFLVIGAKRGGSTSFFYDLLQHPQVAELFPRPDRLPKAAATKGIHYFDTHYDRGARWYRSHLPSRRVRAVQEAAVGGRVITGEASPYYLFHPGAAARAAAMLPEAKIIAVLRDPVERTHSHWKERRRSNAEPLGFAEALAAEDERIGDVEARLASDPAFTSAAHENFSYRRQSEYGAALERWYERYPARDILVLASEDYYADPQRELDKAVAFLGLPSAPIASGEVRNAAAGAGIDPALAASLRAGFAADVEKLTALTGRTFPWPGAPGAAAPGVPA